VGAPTNRSRKREEDPATHLLLGKEDGCAGSEVKGCSRCELTSRLKIDMGPISGVAKGKTQQGGVTGAKDHFRLAEG